MFLHFILGKKKWNVPSTNGSTWWGTDLSLPNLLKILWSTHGGVPLGLECTSPSPSKAHTNPQCILP